MPNHPFPIHHACPPARKSRPALLAAYASRKLRAECAAFPNAWPVRAETLAFAHAQSLPDEDLSPMRRPTR